MLNYTALQGRMTADAELKTTPTGTYVCAFTIAVDRDYAKDGQKECDFINCVAWRQSAEFISKYFRKGQEIIVEGSLQVRSFSDKNGSKRYTTEVLVNRARFCGSKKDNETPQNNNAYVPDAYTVPAAPKFEEVGPDDDLPF